MIPDIAYKQCSHKPSAVNRERSQVAQNGSVVDAIIPKVVPSGSAYRLAGAVSCLGKGSIRPYRFSRDSSMFALVKTFSHAQ
ncbi:Uncharacterised protein [Mycobacterium tuberculosis]|nr:Uncharacterised protein [Mycobacterium tuberculosis]